VARAKTANGLKMLVIKKNINSKFQSLAEKLNNITRAIEILSPDTQNVNDNR